MQVFLFLSRAQVNAQLWSKYQNGLFAIFDTNFRSPMQRVLSWPSKLFFYEATNRKSDLEASIDEIRRRNNEGMGVGVGVFGEP